MRDAWRVLGAVGLVGVGVVAAPVSPAVTSDVIIVFATLVAAAFFVGPRLFRAPRRPWRLFGWSFVLTVLTVLSVLSVPVYAWARDRTGLAASAQNALTVPAYVLLLGCSSTLTTSRWSTTPGDTRPGTG